MRRRVLLSPRHRTEAIRIKRDIRLLAAAGAQLATLSVGDRQLPKPEGFVRMPVFDSRTSMSIRSVRQLAK